MSVLAKSGRSIWQESHSVSALVETQLFKKLKQLSILKMMLDTRKCGSTLLSIFLTRIIIHLGVNVNNEIYLPCMYSVGYARRTISVLAKVQVHCQGVGTEIKPRKTSLYPAG